MSLVLYGNGVVDSRGILGGNLHSVNKAGSIHMARTSKIHPFSNPQSLVKSFLSIVSAQWSKSLTKTQRDGWNTYAHSHPYFDIYGVQRELSGHQWYNKCNYILQSNLFPQQPNNPGGAAVPTIPTVTVTCDITGGPNLVVSTTYFPYANALELVMRTTKSISPGSNSYAHRFSIIGRTPIGFTGGTDVTDWLPDYLGTYSNVDPRVTKKIAVLAMVFDPVTGLASAANGADCIVT